MRIPASIVLGLVVGALLAAIGAALNFLWDEYLSETVIEVFSGSPGGWNIFQLANIIIYAAVTSFGLAFVGDAINTHFAKVFSSVAVGWSATVVVFLWLLTISALNLLVLAGQRIETTYFALWCVYFVFFVGVPTFSCGWVTRQGETPH